MYSMSQSTSKFVLPPVNKKVNSLSEILILCSRLSRDHFSILLNCSLFTLNAEPTFSQ